MSIVDSDRTAMTLIEETWLIKGSSLHHKVYGRCRLKWMEGDRFSYIIDKEKNKIGCTADGWGRILGGRLLEWNTNNEIAILEE